MKFIPLDAVLAEIERRIKRFREEKDSVSIVKTNTYKGIISFINTLEVKEVDFDKYLKEDIEDVFFDLNGVAIKGATSYLTVEDIKDIAKHFFELGVNASNPLTWEDIKLIWTIGDEIPYMPEEDFFKELLKCFKAQKGE